MTDAIDGAITSAGATSGGTPVARNFDLLLDVPVEVTVEIGRARLAIRDLLQLGQGSVVELGKLAGEPLDVLVNGKRIARGEAVLVNDRFGVRLTEVIGPGDRLAGLG